VAIFVTHNPLIDAALSGLLGGLNNLPTLCMRKGDMMWLEFDKKLGPRGVMEYPLGGTMFLSASGA
jgi:hypothetical protein